MDRFMSQKYERIVLRPEINSAEITSSYLQCVKQIHARSDSPNFPCFTLDVQNSFIFLVFCYWS